MSRQKTILRCCFKEIDSNPESVYCFNFHKPMAKQDCLHCCCLGCRKKHCFGCEHFYDDQKVKELLHTQLCSHTVVYII